MSDSPVHLRFKERGSGHIEQERSNPVYRMGSPPGCVSEIMETMGTTNDRPICDQPNKKVTSVCGSSRGSSSDSSRRHVAKLVQLGPLRLSSIRHDKEGTQQVSGERKLQDDPSSSLVAAKGMVPRPTEHGGRRTQTSATQTRSLVSTSRKKKTSKPPHASTDRLETLIRFTKFRHFSYKVSKSIYGARGPSTNALYQQRWATFVVWCRSRKISASKPSINDICEFFLYLFEDKNLSVNTIRGYRSSLHTVLRHTGLKINKDEDITDVIRSLKIRAPVKPKRTVLWNLDVLLKHLCSERFEPLSSASLLCLTEKTIILVTLALAKRISEIQALSRSVGFGPEGAILSLTLEFRAKNDFKCRRLDRHFLVKELESLVGPEEEALLCPVRALRTYLERTKDLVGERMDRLFVSPRNPRRPASKNALTCLIKRAIREAHESLRPDLMPILKVKTHELRAVSTSVSFEHNLSLRAVMEAAQWRCNSVFAAHYLKDISYVYGECRTLGPLVVAGTVIA